jgi:hypothetical protein
VALNRAAAQKIPASMPAFLRRAVRQIAYLGPEPDRWREASEPALKGAQEPDHFVNLDRLAGLRELPATRYEFFRYLEGRRAAAGVAADEYRPEAIGLQPYITVEIYERLKASFRDYRRLRAAGRPTAGAEQAAIHYAGWLGHYVADGSNPLHTSRHYNGWVGENPKGYTTSRDFHRKLESDSVVANMEKLQFAHLIEAPVRLRDPFRDYVEFLRGSLRLTETAYRIEQRKGFDGEGTAEAREFLRQRLAAGAQMLLNLWYTAWLESAAPVGSAAGPGAPR